jgi:hypothetical protein
MESKMETFTVNKNSWHYKLVYEHIIDKYPYNLREKAMPKDFCSYWRRVTLESMKKATFFSVIIAALLFIIGGISHLFYLILFDFTASGIPILIVLMSVAVIFFVMYIPQFLHNRRLKKLKEEDDKVTTQNIFAQRYKAWKGKFCPSIEYEGN